VVSAAESVVASALRRHSLAELERIAGEAHGASIYGGPGHEFIQARVPKAWQEYAATLAANWRAVPNESSSATGLIGGQFWSAGSGLPSAPRTRRVRSGPGAGRRRP